MRKLWFNSMKEIMKLQPFTVRAYSTELRFRRDGELYINDEYKLSVSVRLEEFSNTGAVRQLNTITNNSDREVLLSGFSSANIVTSRGLVGVDRNRWQAEGQWNFFTAAQCGLIQASTHSWERETYTIASVGSWSTGVFYPLTVVIGEDGYSYYMELEGAHNWQLTHSVTGGFDSPIYELEGTSADEENGGWTYLLKPGESYTTQPAVFGRVKGGFEEVCGELVAYKREASLVHFEKDVIPVVFNDYMDCLWGNPSDKKLLPLIDAASKVGCEYFCIDAGWYKNGKSSELGSDWGGRAGDWIVDNERFGEGGLAGIFAHMKEKGLTPGVWFEFDTVNSGALAYELDDDCLLKRYGKVITRAFFNFRNEKVKKHLMSRIDELYGMGVRYIKNDYNQTTGIGCDNDGSAPAEGLIRNYEAFVEFIDEAIASHPGLIIENCGSGACRADNGTLKHFYLQSTSDQEYYYNYPSIIIGSAAQYAHEKAGIWSYPMPVHFEARETETFGDEWRSQFNDCEETIFNMVNGMCGNLYQSGRLEHSDEANLAYVSEGIAAYKKMRGDIVKAHPILPTGTCLIGERCSAAFGLEAPDRSHAYLAVWRIGTDDELVKIDLSKYGYKRASAFYPSTTECRLEDGILTVKLPKEYSARMLLLEK